MKYRRVAVAVIKWMFTPRRRSLSYLCLAVFAFTPLVVVFVTDQLTVTTPALADVDIRVVIVEEHHEGKRIGLYVFQ